MGNGKAKKGDPRRGSCSFCQSEYEIIERHMKTCKLRPPSYSGKDPGKYVFCLNRDDAGNSNGDDGGYFSISLFSCALG